MVWALFSSDQPLDDLLAMLSTIPVEALLLEHLEDQAWETVCKDQFKPLKFGRNLWICPTWHAISDSNAIIVLLDPGLAFGTGAHPTTQLCIAWLEKNKDYINHKTIIDYGCGSGILGITALKLGAKKVIGIDIDPQAIYAAQENALKNQVSIEACSPDNIGLHLQTADIIMANILANPIIELADKFYDYLSASGKLILSGILEEQANLVINAYKNKFILQELSVQEEWLRIEFSKKDSINNFQDRNQEKVKI